MRVRLEARGMRHASVHVRVVIIDAQTKTGVGHLHLRRDWWERIRRVIAEGCALEGLPFELDDTADLCASEVRLPPGAPTPIP